jgi:GxxExxY protein
VIDQARKKRGGPWGQSGILHRPTRVKERLNAITNEIISAALEVHRELGPGLLESTYDSCLTYELLARGYSLERQKPLPLTYKGQTLDCGYRLDLLVDNAVVVEVKAIRAP